MNVWIVFAMVEYDGELVEGVFSSQEAAQRWIDANGKPYGGYYEARELPVQD